MPAISFSTLKQKILTGDKKQTIRPKSGKDHWVKRAKGDTLVGYWHQRSPDNEKLFESQLSEDPFVIKGSEFTLELAKKDGFDTLRDMRDWFRDKYGDGYKEKEFVVLRWEGAISSQIRKLKNKQLGRVERRVLWYLRGGHLEPTEYGELSKISMKMTGEEDGAIRHFHREKFQKPEKNQRQLNFIVQNVYSADFSTLVGSRYGSEDEDLSLGTMWELSDVISNPPQKYLSSVSRALNNLKNYGLASSEYQGREKLWGLTRLGEAVVNAYQDELRKKEKIRWNEDRIARWLY